MEIGYREGISPYDCYMGLVPSLQICFFNFRSRNAYFSAFFDPSKSLLLHCNVEHCNAFRSIPSVRLPSLAFQVWLTVAESKAMEFPQKRALNIIFLSGV